MAIVIELKLFPNYSKKILTAKKIKFLPTGVLEIFPCVGLGTEQIRIETIYEFEITSDTAIQVGNIVGGNLAGGSITINNKLES